jgi:hypothetical protein
MASSASAGDAAGDAMGDAISMPAAVFEVR